MFPPDDNPNVDPSPNIDSQKDLDNIDANVSARNVAARKNNIERVFVKLIAIGLVVGAILGVGAYYLMNKFGLNKKPYQLEQERIEREQEQIPAEDTKVFFPSSKTFKG
ncbi:hypothetical protein IQ255_17120 [Pleurocapsales cyanobacterium LEGE 10410]|nr:hypothetical protein [Pleurocapsales cyanobacterium LEGE 10410]